MSESNSDNLKALKTDGLLLTNNLKLVVHSHAFSSIIENPNLGYTLIIHVYA